MSQLQTTQEKKPRAKSPTRRKHIVNALKKCMVEKGYADTSLTDLAQATGMTVSHLLYYYPNKDAVLLELSDELQSEILVDVLSHKDDPVDERIHRLVDNVFGSPGLGATEQRLVLELYALSAYRPELKERHQAHFKRILDYLVDIFEKAPRHSNLTAAHAAEIAAALWTGLLSHGVLGTGLTESMARMLFRRMLLSLANLDDNQVMPIASDSSSGTGAGT